jgi:hypothetical protein
MDWIDFKIEGEETKFDLELPTFTVTTQQFQGNFSSNLKPYSVKPLTSFAQLEPSKSSSGPSPPGAGGGGGGGAGGAGGPPRPPPPGGVPSRGAGGSPGGGAVSPAATPTFSTLTRLSGSPTTLHSTFYNPPRPDPDPSISTFSATTTAAPPTPTPTPLSSSRGAAVPSPSPLTTPPGAPLTTLRAPRVPPPPPPPSTPPFPPPLGGYPPLPPFSSLPPFFSSSLGASATPPTTTASRRYLPPPPPSSLLTHVGIFNTGNTCFYNAMLQLLWDMKLLKYFFLKLTRDEIKSLQPLTQKHLGNLEKESDDVIKTKPFFTNYDLFSFRTSITPCFIPKFTNGKKPENNIKGIKGLNNVEFHKNLLLGLKEFFEAYSNSVNSYENPLNPQKIKIEKIGKEEKKEEEKKEEEEEKEKEEEEEEKKEEEETVEETVEEEDEEERDIKRAMAASLAQQGTLSSDRKNELEDELKGKNMSLPVLFYFYIRNKEPDFVYGYQTDTSIFFQILSDTLSCFLMDQKIYNVWRTFTFSERQTFSNNGKGEREGTPFLRSILSIELLSKESTIQDLIDNYQTREKMTEENMPNTGETHKKQTLQILKETRNIVIQLKRFDINENKLQTIVTPDPTITIEGYEFKLIGCCVHLGNSVNSGHYTYITFDEDGEELSTVDDSLVIKATKKGYQRNQYLENGYIYLYERLNTA